MNKDFIYKPIPGFFDISKKPKTITVTEHRKLQELQTTISKAGKKSDYKHMEFAWERWVEAAAKLQQVILAHWTLEELTG